MSDWQPIETAPKDGTQILLFISYAGNSQARYWIEWNDCGAKWSIEWTDQAIDFEPTHWTPLEPPK